MARLRKEPQLAQSSPSRWEALLGPTVVGLGILLLIGWALSA